MDISIDIKGLRFGRLVAIRKTKYRSGRQGVMWEFRCDCGNLCVGEGISVRNGHKKSCGCFHQESLMKNGTKNATHGMSHTRQFKIWMNLRRRCNDKNNKAYQDYGGRGITYDSNWDTFQGFWKDVKNGYHDSLSLDRIDNSKGYSKENCRWATRRVQNNNRRNNILYSYDGQSKTLGDWAISKKISYASLYARMNVLQWGIERALLTPKRGTGNLIT